MSMWKADNRAATILVVDDVPGNRAILCRRLSRLGYDCMEADSGEAALEHLRSLLPDIVLLDYMMPNMNGIEMLDAMKSEARTQAIPVIMVTARTASTAIAEALNAGADDYVTKPIDFTNLEARIKNVLQRSRKSSESAKINQALDNRIVMRALELAEMQEELAHEKTRCSELEQEISTKCTAGPGCDECCRESNLHTLCRIEELFGKMWEPLLDQPLNSILRAEIRANIAEIRKTLISQRPEAM